MKSRVGMLGAGLGMTVATLCAARRRGGGANPTLKNPFASLQCWTPSALAQLTALGLVLTRHAKEMASWGLGWTRNADLPSLGCTNSSSDEISVPSGGHPFDTRCAPTTSWLVGQADEPRANADAFHLADS